MKLTIKKDDIISVLNSVEKLKPETLVFSTSNSGDISFSFRADANEFRFTGKTNLKTKETKVAIKAALFVAIVRKLSKDSFSLETLENKLKIVCGNSTFELTIEKDAPEIEIDKELTKANELATIKPDDLITLINKVAFACAKKETRPMLSGINFKIENKSLVLAGLDGARLSVAKYKADIETPANITISAKDIVNLVSVLDKGDKETKILATESKFYITQEKCAYSTTLLNGIYPDITRFTNAKNADSIVLKIKKQALLDAIDLVGVVANEKCTIKMTVKSDEIKLESNTDQVGKAVKVISNDDFTYDEKGTFEILFNGEMLADALNAIDKDEVEINLLESLKPFYFKDKVVYEMLTPMRA